MLSIEETDTTQTKHKCVYLLVEAVAQVVQQSFSDQMISGFDPQQVAVHIFLNQCSNSTYI